MKTCDDNAFELAIVDPPYGINADVSQNKAGKVRLDKEGNIKSNHGWKSYKETSWDSHPPSPEYFKELFRVSKNQIVWGGNYMIGNLHPSQGWVCWNKMQREFSLADGELAWTSFNLAMRIFDMSRGEALSKNSKRFHPTQKPVKLYDWLLVKYAKPGDKILDTHLGSGSSAIAAHYAGHDFVGCEIDKDYFDAAQARIESATAQVDMF